ncbi:MAG: DUF86 domain-containing protein [Candidatus Goldiibacteriota bacterium]
MKDDSIYIHHIYDAVIRIEKYTSEKDLNDFLKSELIQDAVIRQFQIIGEAAKRISEETKSKNKDILWKEMCGMRDKLIHGYFGTDIESVWETVIKDLPALKKNIEKNLPPA